MTRSAGPATSGSSRMRARSWSARCLSWPSCRWPSGRLVASASTGTLPSSARTSAGGRRSARNGPCSGARSAVTGPASAEPRRRRRRRRPLGDLDHGQRRALRVLQHQVVGVAGDGAGRDGERDRDRPGRAVGELASGGDGGQIRGREIPGQRAERARGEQLKLAQLLLVGGPGGPVGQLAGNRSAVTCASVFAGLGRRPGSDDAGEAVQRLADHVKQLIVAVGEASSGQPGDGGAGDSHRR